MANLKNPTRTDMRSSNLHVSTISALLALLGLDACVEPQASSEGAALTDEEPPDTGPDATAPEWALAPSGAEPLAPSAAAACNGTSSPFSTGPRCCLRATVLRPWLGTCQPFSDLSPNRDYSGAYNGAADRPNTLPATADTLQVCGMYVIDNGEGSGGVHGPMGNLYIDIFDSSEPLLTSANGADRRRIGQPRQLRGPHRTHGTTDEWLDDELQRYQQFGAFSWGDRSALIVRIWESDGSEDGSWGRRNDVLGMERVSRVATRPGLWVPLHTYTNDHPRRRTAAVSGWIYLKTGGDCPR